MSWYEQAPLVELILEHQSPDLTFVDYRLVHPIWNQVIQSEGFCKRYYEQAICKTQNQLVTVDKYVDDAIPTAFRRCKYLKELQGMYSKLMSVIGFSNKKKHFHNKYILSPIHKYLTDKDLNLLKEKFKEWNTTNFLREDTLIPIHDDGVVLIADNGVLAYTHEYLYFYLWSQNREDETTNFCNLLTLPKLQTNLNVLREFSMFIIPKRLYSFAKQNITKLSAFTVFCREKRKEGSFSLSEAQEDWKYMRSEVKHVYEIKAEEDLQEQIAQFPHTFRFY